MKQLLTKNLMTSQEVKMGYVAGTIASQCEQMRKQGVAEGGALRPDTASESPDLNEIGVIVLARQSVETESSIRTDAYVAIEKKLQDLNQKVEVVDASCDNLLDHDLLDGAFQSALAKHEKQYSTNDLMLYCVSHRKTPPRKTSICSET